MDFIDDIPSLRVAIATFQGEHAGQLAGLTRTALAQASGAPSPVEQFTATVETLYAGLDAIASSPSRRAAAQLVGQLAGFIISMWQTLSLDAEPDRGARILAAMRRRVGESTGPDPAEDPIPRADLVPPAP